jgi:hypothetical protein
VNSAYQLSQILKNSSDPEDTKKMIVVLEKLAEYTETRAQYALSDYYLSINEEEKSSFWLSKVKLT